MKSLGLLLLPPLIYRLKVMIKTVSVGVTLLIQSKENFNLFCCHLCAFKKIKKMKIIMLGLLNSRSIYSILVQIATFLSCTPCTILCRHTDDTRKQSVGKTSVFRRCVTGILSTENTAMTVSHRLWKLQVIDQTNTCACMNLSFKIQLWVTAFVRTIQLLFSSRVDRPQLWKTPLSCQLVVQTHPSTAGWRRRTGPRSVCSQPLHRQVGRCRGWHPCWRRMVTFTCREKNTRFFCEIDCLNGPVLHALHPRLQCSSLFD